MTIRNQRFSLLKQPLSSTLFLISAYIITGLLNRVWFPGEVAVPLINLGGSSAIFFMFFAKDYEEKSLSLLSFFLNSIYIFYILQMPDLCGFLAGLFLILLALCHFFLFFGSNVLFHFIFFSVLLSRIFFHQKMGEWGFGLVTELIAIKLYFLVFELFLNRKCEEKFRIKPLYFLPFFTIFVIAFLNLLYLDHSLNKILIQINFLFTGASLLVFIFFAQTLTELKISFFVYIVSNCSIGYALAQSVITFLSITFVFLLFNGAFATFYFLKAQRANKPLSHTLLANKNKREGIQTLLVVYLLLLNLLLTQLKPGSAGLSPYSNWIMELGIQIGFLTALNYFFKN